MPMNVRNLGWLALVLAALSLRAWGIGFGSPPTMIHPDEIHYGDVAERMSWSDLDPHYFENPPLLTDLLFAGRQVHALCVGAEANERWIQEGGLYRLGRWIAVLLGSATVLLVGAAAWQLLGSPGAALAAGAVVACSFLHGRDSHFGVNDVPMVALVACSLFFASRTRSQVSLRGVWCSAIFAGLAAAMKYSGGVAIALPLAAVALRRGTRATRLREAGGVLLLAGAAFLVANPWPLLDAGGFGRDFVNQWSGWGDRRAAGQADRPAWSLYGEATLAMLGLAHACAAAAGLVLLLRRDPRGTLLLLAAPALYLAVMFNKQLFYWRFALPLLPFLAVAAGAAWEAVARRLAPTRTPVLLAVLVVLASVQPAVALARHDWLISRPSTWLLARDWIVEHVPAGEIVCLEGFPPSLPQGRYRRTLSDDDLAKLAALSVAAADVEPVPTLSEGAWFVTDSWYDSSWERSLRAGSPAPFQRRLRQHLTPRAEFAPGPNGDQPFILDALYSPLTDLWAVDRPGFTIRVYRVGSEDWERLVRP
jgi:hypothetical protein